MTYHLWLVPLIALTLLQLAAVATSVYLHRGLAHRAVQLHPVTDVGFRAILWLTTGQNRREWVAVHRKHHTFTDKEGDPHSPRLFGLWRVQLMGPWIVTGLDPDALRVTIRVNGREMFSYTIKDAIFGVRQFISRMSQYLTLHPGDVLWMGTDGATENIKDGDVVEIEIPGIGVLRNPVVRER